MGEGETKGITTKEIKYLFTLQKNYMQKNYNVKNGENPLN